MPLFCGWPQWNSSRGPRSVRRFFCCEWGLGSKGVERERGESGVHTFCVNSTRARGGHEPRRWIRALVKAAGNPRVPLSQVPTPQEHCLLLRGPFAVALSLALPNPLSPLLVTRRPNAQQKSTPAAGPTGEGGLFTIGIAEEDRPRRCRAHLPLY